MGIGIAIAVLVVLAFLPLGIHIRYNDSGFLLRVIVGPIKITIFPRKKKPKNQKVQSSKKTSEKKTEAAPLGGNPPPPPEPQSEHKEKGGSLTRFLPLIKLALEFLGDFRRKLRLDDLYLRLVLAGDDPCDLAVNYGRVWTALGNLMPQMERLFVIRKRDIQVECDFTAEEVSVIAHLRITITLGRLLMLAVIYGIRVLIELILLKRKGGGEK